MVTLSGSLLIVTVLFAAWTDWKFWRIPNTLIVGSATAAVMLILFQAGPRGLASAIIGGLVGLALFLPFYVVKGMGAGDVKLLGVAGLYTGPENVVFVAIISALIGGVWAIVLCDLKRDLGISAWIRLKLHSNKHLQKLAIVDYISKTNPKSVNLNFIPYGLVIAAGTLVTLFYRPIIGIY